MLFPEQDAPTLKTWIVQRLETPARTDGDVDSDVLADYVLALLRHDGESSDVRQLCETELYDFLKDEAKPFVADVFQAVAYKSYIPGSRPPPKLPPTQKQPPAVPSPAQNTSTGPVPAPSGGTPSGLPWLHSQQHQQPSYKQGGAKKRSYHESSIAEAGGAPAPAPAVGGLYMQNGQGAPYPHYQQGGGRASKQPRRSGRGGAGETEGHASDAEPAMGAIILPPPPFGAPVTSAAASPLSGSLPLAAATADGTSLYDPSAALFIESLMQMHQMGMPLPMYGFPLGAGAPWSSHGDDSGRRRRRRCRFFEKKGYCTRPNCKFAHGDTRNVEDAAAAAVNGHGGGFPMMPPPSMTAAMFQHMMPPLSQQGAEVLPEMQGPHGTGAGAGAGAATRPRKGGRAPFSADGPVYDKSNSTVVVEGIPDESLNEAAVREFFSQFGAIASVSMQPKKRLAIVKFDAWTAANAAYHSPKVIFDNRFVKVFWHKEKAGGGTGGGDETNGVSTKKNGGSVAEAEEGEVIEGGDEETPEMDMEDFLRRQEEAQKRHQEKAQLKQELDRKRQELEQRQQALQARQREERQRLIAKMAAVATRARQGSKSGTPSEAGGGGEDNGSGENRGESSSSRSAAAISQTEMIRAQLAALEEEARQLGLDPDLITGGGGGGAVFGDGGGDRGGDDTLSSALPSWRGRGRGRGGRFSWHSYRGRGGRGGYPSARGGLHGSVSSSVASAYAAYSLDNRPRKIAVTGVDFTAPEQDEALRQYLLGIGDFVAIDTTAESTTITFTDRRTAEKFYYGLATAPGLQQQQKHQSGKSTGRIIPGVADAVELAWVAGGAVASSGLGASSRGPSTGSVTASGSRLGGRENEPWQSDEKEGELDIGMDDDNDNDDGVAVEEENGDADGRQQEQKHHADTFPRKQQQMDFDVADEGDWDIE